MRSRDRCRYDPDRTFTGVSGPWLRPEEGTRSRLRCLDRGRTRAVAMCGDRPPRSSARCCSWRPAAGCPTPTPWRARSSPLGLRATRSGWPGPPRPCRRRCARDPAFRSAAAASAWPGSSTRRSSANVGRLPGRGARPAAGPAAPRGGARGAAPAGPRGARRPRRPSFTFGLLRPGRTPRGGRAPGPRGAGRVAGGDPWCRLRRHGRGRPGQAAVRGRAPPVRLHRRPPGIHPPRLSLARARLARGDRDGALAALDDLLALDPDHGAAKELKAALLAPPPVERLAPVVPTTAPRPPRPRASCRGRRRRVAEAGVRWRAYSGYRSASTVAAARARLAASSPHASYLVKRRTPPSSMASSSPSAT